MKQAKYFQFEPNAFLSDYDFGRMTAEQRGVYFSLICYLYCNNGKLAFDLQYFKLITNCENFDQIWPTIRKKFSVRRTTLRHKRVSSELKKANDFMQASSQAGLKGAEKRWGGHSDPNGKPIAKKRNVIEKVSKVTNTNTSTDLLAPSSSNSFREKLISKIDGANSIVLKHMAVYDGLTKIIHPRNQSDRTCFNKFSFWLAREVEAGALDDDVFARVLDWAAEAATGNVSKPAAVFMSILRKELKYNPKRTTT